MIKHFRGTVNKPPEWGRPVEKQNVRSASGGGFRGDQEGMGSDKRLAWPATHLGAYTGREGSGGDWGFGLDVVESGIPNVFCL